MPVVDYYRKEGKVVDVGRNLWLNKTWPYKKLTLGCLFVDQIDSSKTVEAVYADISAALDGLARRKSLSLEGR